MAVNVAFVAGRVAADEPANAQPISPVVDVQQYPSRRSLRRAAVPEHDFEVLRVGTGRRGPVAVGVKLEPVQPEGSALAPSRRTAAEGTSETLKAPRSARRLARMAMSISAVLAVGLMTVATSLPANALLSADEVHTQKHAALESERGTDAGGSQSMVGTSANIGMDRDTYGALSATEAAAQLGIRPEATFTNDPNGTIQWPFSVGVHVGSGYGPRPGCAIGCSTNHLGQDFNPGYGAPIQSVADGVVIESTDTGGNFGVKIVIEHTIKGEVVRSLYAHMTPGSRTVQVGDHVASGQNIGKTGNTGISTGPHLHLEITLNGRDNVDPLAWLNKNTN